MEIRKVGTHHLVQDDEEGNGFLRILDHKNRPMWYEVVLTGWLYIGDDQSNRLELKFQQVNKNETQSIS